LAIQVEAFQWLQRQQKYYPVQSTTIEQLDSLMACEDRGLLQEGLHPRDVQIQNWGVGLVGMPLHNLTSCMVTLWIVTDKEWGRPKCIERTEIKLLLA